MALHVELLTNVKKIYSGHATKVTLPTETGIVEVLPHHVPFVINLAPGTIIIQDENKKPVRVPSVVGVSYKNEENVTILIEEAHLNKLK